MTVGVKENHFMTDPKETDRLIGRVLAGKIFFFSSYLPIIQTTHNPNAHAAYIICKIVYA